MAAAGTAVVAVMVAVVTAAEVPAGAVAVRVAAGVIRAVVVIRVASVAGKPVMRAPLAMQLRRVTATMQLWAALQLLPPATLTTLMPRQNREATPPRSECAFPFRVMGQ